MTTYLSMRAICNPSPYFTTSVKPVDAVRPEDITVMVGMKLPTIADPLASNVRVPEGLVSVDAYFTWTPQAVPTPRPERFRLGRQSGSES